MKQVVVQKLKTEFEFIHNLIQIIKAKSDMETILGEIQSHYSEKAPEF